MRIWEGEKEIFRSSVFCRRIQMNKRGDTQMKEVLDIEFVGTCDLQCISQCDKINLEYFVFQLRNKHNGVLAIFILY